MKKMRLDKFLATYTTLSRKEAKRSIRQGEIQVDGETALEGEKKISPCQHICMRGQRIEAKEHIYIMMNKPAGVLSATRDKSETTVVECVECEGRELFPVGRLDKDTEGFLLLTDDGQLAHRLLSPAYHVPKTYYFTYEGKLAENAAELVAEGIDIGEGVRTKAGVLRLMETGTAELTIEEGKYHQVKRMIAALGGRVTYLKRISMAGLALDDNLRPGEYRELTEDELAVLIESANRN